MFIIWNSLIWSELVRLAAYLDIKLIFKTLVKTFFIHKELGYYN